MTGEIIKDILVWILSLGETALCFRLLFLGREGRPGILEKAGCTAAVILAGSLAALWRQETPFSGRILLMETGLVCLILAVEKGREAWTDMLLAALYFTGTALAACLFSFLSVCAGREGNTVEILFCLDVAVFWLENQMKHVEEEFRDVLEENRSALALAFFQGLVVFGIYQVMFGERHSLPGRELAGAAIVLGIMAAVLVFAFLLFRQNLQTAGELEFAAVREKALEENYQRLAGIMEENREQVHDMKHHLTVLGELAREEGGAELQNYLKEMGETIFQSDRLAWTGSRMLNTILNQKKEELKRQETELEIQADRDFQVPLTDREICTVYCNLLDNAGEACQKVAPEKRRIRVELHRQGEMSFTVIENSTAGKPKEKNGRFLSDKGDGHGLGLRSVSRIVRRHQGDLQFTYSEERFRAALSFFQ